MSRSSLWLVDNQYKGTEEVEYNNAWLFSPMIWDVLLDKYMHDEIQTPYGFTKSMTGCDAPELDKKLTRIMDTCENLNDRICWELTNQFIFSTKDKIRVSKAIVEFVKENTEFAPSSEGTYPLQSEHIKERFIKIAGDILSIDEEKHPYFIIKNTSVDDNVEFWFDEEKTLKDWNDKKLTYFVDIDRENNNLLYTVNADHFESKPIEKLKVSKEVAEALDKQSKSDWDKQFNLIGHCKGFSGNGIKCGEIYKDEFKILETLSPLDYARCLIAGYEVEEPI